MIPLLNISDIKSNWACGKKQAEICVIAIGTGIRTSRAKPNALHKFFLHLRKIPYIIQIIAIAISVMQMPKVNITDLFNSKDKIASSGIGMALTTTKVFKTIFVLEIRLGSIISHAAMIETAAINDHDQLSEVK